MDHRAKTPPRPIEELDRKFLELWHAGVREVDDLARLLGLERASIRLRITRLVGKGEPGDVKGGRQGK
jgi:hypothetical protein